MTPTTKLYILDLITEKQKDLQWKINHLAEWEQTELREKKSEEVNDELEKLESVIQEINTL